MTESELLHIFRRSKQYPKGYSRVTIIDKDYIPAGAKDLMASEYKAFEERVDNFMRGTESIGIDSVPEDMILRCILLGLKSQSTSMRAKCIGWLLEMKGIKQPPKPEPEPDPEEVEEEPKLDPKIEELLKGLET